MDAIARLMGFKCDRNLSRDGFDDLLTVIGSILPQGHLLTKNMYESTKILRALKMTYEQIDACPKGCMLFRKEQAGGKYCIHCKSSRFFEVDAGGFGFISWFSTLVLFYITLLVVPTFFDHFSY